MNTLAQVPIPARRYIAGAGGPHGETAQGAEIVQDPLQVVHMRQPVAMRSGGVGGSLDFGR